MKTREEKLAAIEAAMVRWIRRQGRAATELAKLQRKKQRLLKPRDPTRVAKMSPAMAKALEIADAKVKPIEHFDDLAVMPSNVRPRGHARIAHLAEDLGPALREAGQDAGIPAFLDRGNPVVAEEMTAARKKAEAEQRKKMPLTGKAALEAIRSPQPKRRTRRTEA